MTHHLTALILLAACASDKTVVVRNSPPGATITSPAEGIVYEAGALVEFKGIVSDAQTSNDELVVTWDTDKDGLLTDEAFADVDGLTTFSTADLTPGETHTVTLRAVDAGGKSASDTVVITIEEGFDDTQQEPEVTIIAPHPSGSDSPWDEGEPFSFEAQVEDLQDAASDLVVTIDTVDDAGELLVRLCTTIPTVTEDDDTVGYVICEASLEPGNHIIVFGAKDTEGNVGTAQGQLRIQSSDAVDNDGDGYTELEGDCDDTDEDVHPGAFEYENGIDDDCDGDTDEGTDSFDDDGDGYTEDAGDCDDTDPEVHPLATEVCDGIDNDCSGEADGEDAVDGVTYYQDVDGDGYGNWAAPLTSCETPGGYVLDSTDCNDIDSSAYPGAEESCDGTDNDCDGFTDEEGATGCTTWYQDLDDDGYGSTVSICACSATGDFTSTLSSDCYDTSASVNPTHTTFHTSDRGDGSYDYNCNSVEERETVATSDSCAWFDDLGCSSPDGWAGSPPTCGSSGTWRTGCHYEWDWFSSGCYWTTESSRTQACR